MKGAFMASSTTNHKRSLDELLAGAEKLLAGAVNPSVEPVMARFNYSKAQVAPGAALLAVARDKVTKRSIEFGEQIAAGKEHDALEEAFHDRYINAVGFARVSLRNDMGAVSTLKFYDARKKSNNGYFEQAEAFYNALLIRPDWILAMKPYGYSEDLIREEKLLLDEYREAKLVWENETAEAITATAERDKALDALFDWTGQYKEVARLALKSRPDLLRLLDL